MPELPEVEGLARFLTARAVGRTIAGVGVGAIGALKTFDPPLEALVGQEVTGASRHGKWLDLVTTGPHLLMHLSRGGWLKWSEKVSTAPVRPGRSPLALRVRLDDGAGFELSEYGTRKRLAVHVVSEPTDVEQVATLGVDPLSDEFTPDRLAELAAARNQQIKGLLRDQGTIAGIGNAYSDEILHAARMSPFALSARLDAVAVGRLHDVIRQVLSSAVAEASGRPAAELKDAKRRGMQVHGRTGEPCPVCGDVVREVSFADSSLQYCATCQTDGKPLADRRLSRLLR
ncbi:DNA-formamidopyrimidine glycosylase family protein [Isoptericola sp. b490]|uniref:Fpg/Nei family DNA glycosylase n=1 Tax=Actinotalea lenta TaxID=3064654 RepID=UPI0027123612|nr:DNA-formamidopyrimidine glycosylase family protein [Isoptericola sp. b490]MDO8120982.1 DNA-formamidopyrimidine glycosylase family protein [Isoptericola sp. b490]